MARPSGETVSKLLGCLYEAAACPLYWPAFFDALRNAIPTNKAFFLLVDPEGCCDIRLSYGVDPHWQQLYEEHFCRYDVLRDAFLATSQVQGEWIGTTQSVISDDDYHRSILYNDFIRPQKQTHHCAAMFGKLDGDIVGGITINRRAQDKLFASEEIALLTTISPHLKRALNLHRTLSNERAKTAELRHTVDALDFALISVGTQGRVLRTTLAARAMLQSRDGIWLDHQYLRAGVSKENARLSQLIAGASATGAGRGEASAVCRSTATAPEAGAAPLWTPSSGGAMLISRTPPKRPLQVVVTPFCSSEILLAERPAALVLLADPDAQPASRANILRALYALSPAECRMADLLMQGITITTIADQMKTTVGTARFRLKEIFRKTDTARQAQLVQLITVLPGMRTINVEPASRFR